MFQGVVRISVAPFFGIPIEDEEGESEQSRSWEVGTERWGWRLVGQGMVRGT